MSNWNPPLDDEPSFHVLNSVPTQAELEASDPNFESPFIPGDAVEEPSSFAADYWHKRIAQGDDKTLLEQWSSWFAIPGMKYGIIVGDIPRHDISSAAWIDLLSDEMRSRGIYTEGMFEIWSDQQRLESFREELDTFNNSELWSAWDHYWALEDEGIHQEMPAEAMQAQMVWILAVFDEMCRRGF